MSLGKTCPNCLKKEKVLKKCFNCGSYVCVDCSINTLCIDCHVKLRNQDEVDDYVEDKFRKENVVVADLVLEAGS